MVSPNTGTHPGDVLSLRRRFQLWILLQVNISLKLKNVRNKEQIGKIQKVHGLLSLFLGWVGRGLLLLRMLLLLQSTTGFVKLQTHFLNIHSIDKRSTDERCHLDHRISMLGSLNIFPQDNILKTRSAWLPLPRHRGGRWKSGEKPNFSLFF